MTSWRRALLLGLLVWLVPFVVAFAAAPLKQSWRRYEGRRRIIS